MKNRWVQTTKYRIDDNVEREKARLVMKGFTQVCSADYDKTYSPLDMKNAFCQRSNGDPRLILGKGYMLVVMGDYGRTDPLLNKPFYPYGHSVLLGAGWKKSQVDKAPYFKAGDNGVTCWVRLRRQPACRQQQPRDAERAKGAAGGCLRAARDFAGRQVPRARDHA
ncbi:unnamed protein product [Closterium sp. NIES-54]